MILEWISGKWYALLGISTVQNMNRYRIMRTVNRTKQYINGIIFAIFEKSNTNIIQIPTRPSNLNSICGRVCYVFFPSTQILSGKLVWLLLVTNYQVMIHSESRHCWREPNNHGYTMIKCRTTDVCFPVKTVLIKSYTVKVSFLHLI